MSEKLSILSGIINNTMQLLKNMGAFIEHPYIYKPKSKQVYEEICKIERSIQK